MDGSTLARLSGRTRSRLDEFGRDWNRQTLFYALVLAAIVLLGVSFRLRRLGVAPLWIDEAYNSWAAWNYLNGNGFSDPIGPSSPYRRAWLTTSLPMSVAFDWLGRTEFAARLPSVVYGTLSIGVGYLLGRRYDRLLGFLLAAFLAFDPVILVWSREARMYAPLLFVYLCSVYILVRWYGEAELRLTSVYPYLLAVFVVLGYYTHQSYLALGASVLTFFVIQLVPRLRAIDEYTLDAMDAKTARLLVLAAGATLTAGVFIALRGVPGVLLHTISETWPDRGPLYYGKVVVVHYPILGALSWPGMAYVWRKHETGRLLVLAFLLPLAVATLVPKKAPRYIYHLFPLLAFFGLYSITLVLRRAWRSVTADGSLSLFESGLCYLAPILVVLVVASPIAAYGVTASLYDPPAHPERSDWEKASEWVREHADEDDAIASTRPELSMWYYGETDYFFRQNGVSSAAFRDGQYVHTRTGAVFLNETADIRKLLEGDRDVWLFAGKKFDYSFTSPEARELVREEFERRGNESWVNMKVYYYDASENESAAT
ncbi:glycosyltransferase family 39 protein [Haloarcula amylovorans]|uniref:glycosyltransferase family 39 protein n=1 Tax=Haloarcula amylovorans TaxID=2562280 RepID=UPI001076862D|nr:glycosyltransferase family 39 protein [Halomicroarcula amylolytica]